MTTVYFLLTMIALSIVDASYNHSFDKLVGLSWNLLETSSNFVPLHPDTKLNAPQLIIKYGYPFESHVVTSEDGYILTMHRIPYGRFENLAIRYKKDRPVVLLKHCFMCSSREWLLLGPERSLAFLLADQGYDVWLGNSRGNFYSMKHKTLKHSDEKFWDFSFHEKGYYDIPAFIDYILKLTKKPKLTYIAHSQGTTEAMVLISIKPEYNDKLNVMMFLSPIAYMENVKSPIVQLLHRYAMTISTLADNFGIYGIPWNPWLSKVAQIMCSTVSAFQSICINILELFCGFDLPQLDRSLLTVLMSSTPAGFSVKEIKHYSQEISSGQFHQYDYGEQNNKIYGVASPPLYNISKITCPIVAYYAKNDYLAPVANVEKLLNELPNIIERNIIPYKLFNHFDFVFAKDIKSLVYDSLINTCNKYNSIFNS